MTIQTKAIKPTCTKNPATKRAYRVTVHHTSDTGRDRSYDANYSGNENRIVSVYASGAVIAIDRAVGECASCHRTKPLLNNYCDLCRSNGANEKQVMSPRKIQAKQRAARANSKKSSWRKK